MFCFSFKDRIWNSVMFWVLRNLLLVYLSYGKVNLCYCRFKWSDHFSQNENKLFCTTYPQLVSAQGLLGYVLSKQNCYKL